VLLLELGDDDADHGGYVVGYDVRELRAGRSTVVAIPSLLAVLHEWATDRLRMLRHQATNGRTSATARLATPSNARKPTVGRIEEMRRRAEALPWNPTDR
jgi:hypothetical protein